MVVRLSGTQPQGPKHLETLENKTVDGTQNTVRVNRGTSANRPAGAIIGDLYYNTEIKDLEEYTEDGWLIVAKQVPRVPTIGTANLSGNNDVSVSFTPSQYGQPASSYTVQSNPGSYTATGSSSPITVSGTNLQVGTPYTFRVRSSGTYGQSSYSSYSSSITPVALGNFDSIQTVTVGAGGTAEITFSVIPQTYKHLQIRGIARSTGAGSASSFRIIFNGDESTNYSSHILDGNGSSVSGYDFINGSYSWAGGLIPNAGITSGIFGATIIDILDYTSTNKFKTARTLSGYTGNGGAIELISGNWRSLNAITSITLKLYAPSGYNLAQYSSLSLYGIKE